MYQLQSCDIKVVVATTGIPYRWIPIIGEHIVEALTFSPDNCQLAAPDIHESGSPKLSDAIEVSLAERTTTKHNQKSAHVQLILMRKPNSRRRCRFSTILLKTMRWFTGTEKLYAFCVLVVTLALCIVVVIQSSAGFYYCEKGLWGVIMAELSMVPYTADLVYGIAVRMVGTVVGGIVGMLAWYIGAGSGPGNPYGMAAIMAVVIVVFMWWRLFSPPTLMPAGIMAAGTAYLVAAYSWINTHIPSYGNTTAGYFSLLASFGTCPCWLCGSSHRQFCAQTALCKSSLSAPARRESW